MAKLSAFSTFAKINSRHFMACVGTLIATILYDVISCPYQVLFNKSAYITFIYGGMVKTIMSLGYAYFPRHA